MNFKSIARRWAETWSEAWPDKDIEAMAAFYAPNATYLSVPFRQPDRGVEGVRGYLRREFDVESDIECWFAIPIVDGDRAAIEWWSSWVEGGDVLTLAGSTFLTFNDDGLITDHRDYWNQINERRPPYPGWIPDL
jgi:SnoaL-like domain